MVIRKTPRGLLLHFSKNEYVYTSIIDKIFKMVQQNKKKFMTDEFHLDFDIILPKRDDYLSNIRNFENYIVEGLKLCMLTKSYDKDRLQKLECHCKVNGFKVDGDIFIF